jgi:hypothetical protein
VLSRLFRDVLECKVVEREFGLAHPVLLVQFDDGSRFSGEFTELAEIHTPRPGGDAGAFRGAWIEFRTNDVPGCQQRMRDARLSEFRRHAGSNHLYFSAPGGQVFRLLDVAYEGP